MSLSERSRSAIFQKLSAVVDEQSIEEMLSFFPARDVEEPVTKEHLRAEFAIQRAEVQAEFSAVRSEMSEGFAAVRSEMNEGLSAVRSELHTVERRMLTWTAGMMVTMTGVLLGAMVAIA